MLRHITTLIFLAAFAAQTFERTLIVFDYYINPAGFAKNCENKSRPAMHCNGRCQMMKKLKQEEKKDRENPERKTEFKNELVAAIESFSTPGIGRFACTICFGPDLVCGNPLDRSLPVFHPPALV